MAAYTQQRSVLYVPASNQRAIEKSSTINADWIVFDLEDSVAVEAKALAREALIEAFRHGKIVNKRSVIRCNAVDTEEISADVKAIADCLPNAVLIPKVESTDTVRQFCKIAEDADLNQRISSWFMIETANGIAQLADIIHSAKSMNWLLTTLVVGHNDIASETGVSLDLDRKYMIPWLMQIVLHARANDLRVLDSVWNNFKDLVGFEKEANQARQMGFDGKTLIHPAQVDIASRIFSPTEDEIIRAKRIVDAFNKTENLQMNVVNIDGEMFERLHLRQAERLLINAGSGSFD